jgi:hypothetical protein
MNLFPADWTAGFQFPTGADIFLFTVTSCAVDISTPPIRLRGACVWSVGALTLLPFNYEIAFLGGEIGFVI